MIRERQKELRNDKRNAMLEVSRTDVPLAMHKNQEIK
jgi:hypothetical protein